MRTRRRLFTVAALLALSFVLGGCKSISGLGALFEGIGADIVDVAEGTRQMSAPPRPAG